MELVTKRDMADAKALIERAGLEISMDDWEDFMHDIAQSIADGRRIDAVGGESNACTRPGMTQGKCRHDKPLAEHCEQCADDFRNAN